MVGYVHCADRVLNFPIYRRSENSVVLRGVMYTIKNALYLNVIFCVGGGAYVVAVVPRRELRC